MDHDDSESSSSRGNKRKTRGPTLCTKFKEKIKNKKTECKVEFDQDGNHIGNMASKFASYVGTAGRLHVNINIKSWDLVNEGLKNMVWEDIQMHWNLKDDQMKKQVLEAVAKSWRDFKANLVRYFLRRDRNACDTYSYITEDDWETFKKTHETDEFKEISEKAKESQKHNKDPHFVGKGGYIANRGKWRQNDPIASLDTSQSSIDPSILSSERSYDWIRARTRKNEDGSFYIPNEHTREVFKKMGELQEKITDGSWTPCGHDDVLTRALGNKEHGGRVRGIGGKAKIKSVFGSQKCKQSGVVSIDELDTIKQEITKKVREECQEMMNAQLRGIYDHLKQMGLPLPNDNFWQKENGMPPNELVRSSCHSVDQPENFLDIQVPTLCRLCVKHPDKGKVVVARGQVFPLNSEGGNFIHGKSIAPHNLKVCVDEVLVEFQLTPLPVPCDEHETVGSASGSFVQWPKDLLILGQEPERKKGHKVAPRKLNKVVSKESATPILKNQVFLGDDKISEKCRTLRFLVNNMPPESTTKAVDKNVEVFNFHESAKVPIYVTHEDIHEFLGLSWLNIPVLQIFMMYTHNLCKDLKNSSFAFMCPSILALARDYQDDTSRYMCEVMKNAKEKRFILAPYIQSKHWMLLMYCVDESTVYVFDPLKQKRNIYVKTPWETAYKVYTKYGGKRNNHKNLVWYHEVVQCPQQKGGTECGYYVMKYMYDIVMLSRKDPETKWKEGLGKKYTNQQIEEIRDIWADFFTREYM